MPLAEQDLPAQLVLPVLLAQLGLPAMLALLGQQVLQDLPEAPLAIQVLPVQPELPVPPV